MMWPLAGRVYCNVDTTYSEVCPGDLLTTSSNPGYAMKVKDYARAQGAILGKAMQRLEKRPEGADTCPGYITIAGR